MQPPWYHDTLSLRACFWVISTIIPNAGVEASVTGCHTSHWLTTEYLRGYLLIAWQDALSMELSRCPPSTCSFLRCKLQFALSIAFGSMRATAFVVLLLMASWASASAAESEATPRPLLQDVLARHSTGSVSTTYGQLASERPYRPAYRPYGPERDYVCFRPVRPCGNYPNGYR